MNPNKLNRLFPHASPDFIKANSAVATELPHAQPQQASGSQSIQGDEVKEGSKGRFRVIITRCGTRLLDADNSAGAKLLIDELRYSGAIPNDDPESIELDLRQAKVKKEETGTLIEIYPI